MDELTQLVLQFQKGYQEESVTVKKVAEKIFHYLEEQYGKGKESNAEMLSIFYPRIPNIIKRFRFQGIPFFHYLKRSLKMQKKSLAEKYFHYNTSDYVLNDLQTTEVAEGSSYNEPEFGNAELRKTLLKSFLQKENTDPVAQKKRLLLMSLKSAQFLNNQDIEDIASITETDLAWIQAWIYRLQKQFFPQVCRFKVLARRRLILFTKRLKTENEMSLEVDQERLIQLRKQVDVLKKRQERVTTLMRSLQITPTHLNLSQIMKLPKGSVDSCLYYLKHIFTKEYTEHHDYSSFYKQPSQEKRA